MNSSTKSHAHVLAGFLRSKNTTNPERMTLATNRMTIKRRIQLHQHDIGLYSQQNGIDTVAIEVRTGFMLRPDQANFSLPLHPVETTKDKQTKYQTFFHTLNNGTPQYKDNTSISKANSFEQAKRKNHVRC